MENPSRYQFRCSLEGHSNDIKCFDHSPDGNFLATISRDCYCYLWRIAEDGINYKHENSFFCSTDTPLVIKYCPANKECKVDSVLIGGMSKEMTQFSITDCSKLVTFKHHEGAITCIELYDDYILTGSWDFSICQWDFTGKMLFRFQYHSAAVWCLCTIYKGFLSGSADCLIVKWNETYPTLTYSGHEQPVRCIEKIPDSKYFISAGNDGFLKKWNIDTGECVNSFSAHEHFIYSLCTLKPTIDKDPLVAVSGEERYINIWKNNKLSERILLPCCSGWVVKCLTNSDIVVCCSSKKLYLFSKESSRFAKKEELLEFQKLVSDSVKPSNIDGVNIDSLLPVEEALLIPGKSDGQLKLFREGNKALVYKWEEAQLKWSLIGEALSSAETDKKNIEENSQPYTIDVELPNNIKKTLSYKTGEDPQMVAENFITQNNLSTSYIEEVLQFLLKNIPSAAAYKHKKIPKPSQSSSSNPSQPFISKVSLPIQEYIFFKRTNIDGMFCKLNEINSRLGIELSPDNHIILLKKYVKSTIESEPVLFDTNEFPWNYINKLLLGAQKDSLIPVLDLIKQLVLIPNFFREFFLQSRNPCQLSLVEFFRNLTDENCNKTCAMLVCRCFCNMFIHKDLSDKLIDSCRDIVQLLTSLHLWQDNNEQIASASLLHNFSIKINTDSSKLSTENVHLFLLNVSWILEVLCSEICEEAILRLLSAIGNILTIPRIQLSSGLVASLNQLYKDSKNNPKLNSSKVKPLLDAVIDLVKN